MNAAEMITYKLQSSAEQAQKTLAKNQERLKKAGDNAVNEMLYQLKCAEDFSRHLAYGSTCQQVLAMVSGGKELKASLEAVIEGLTSRIMNDYMRGASTSHFSNAAEHAERAAACEFVRDFSALVKEL